MIETFIGYLASPALAAAFSKLLDQYGGTAWANLSSQAKFVLANLVMSLGSYGAYFLTTHISTLQMQTYDPLVGAVVTLISLVIGFVFHVNTKDSTAG